MEAGVLKEGYGDNLDHDCIRKQEALKILTPFKINKSPGLDRIDWILTDFICICTSCR